MFDSHEQTPCEQIDNIIQEQPLPDKELFAADMRAFKYGADKQDKFGKDRTEYQPLEPTRYPLYFADPGLSIGSFLIAPAICHVNPVTMIILNVHINPGYVRFSYPVSDSQ